MKILIVDDEDIQRQKLVQLISESPLSFSDILCAPEVPTATDVSSSGVQHKQKSCQSVCLLREVSVSKMCIRDRIYVFLLYRKKILK